jgi:hypothetical protein
MASIKRIGKDKSGVPIWEAVYRRTPGGKQVRRRFHAHTKADVERRVLLDTGKPDVAIRWSEALPLYVEAKYAENRNPVHIGHVERAVRVFVEIMGDRAIEETTPADFKHFMQEVVKRRVKHPKTGRLGRASGPGVANHHRKDLITLARYILRHTGKIESVPFLDVPTLPVQKKGRSPISRDLIGDYLNALPEHVRRPVMLVLLYGLRSTAICRIVMADVGERELAAIDKGNVKHRIPIDAALRRIIDGAKAYREGLEASDDRLFVKKDGRAWNHVTLLRAAQRAWVAAGLEKKKIHEIRHTLGTMAGKYFSVGSVQAAMRHRSRRSSETYFHPDEEMAAEVRQKIITELSQNFGKDGNNGEDLPTIRKGKNGVCACPHCLGKFLISNK